MRLGSESAAYSTQCARDCRGHGGRRYAAALKALEHTGARGKARTNIEALCRSLVDRTY